MFLFNRIIKICFLVCIVLNVAAFFSATYAQCTPPNYPNVYANAYFYSCNELSVYVSSDTAPADFTLSLYNYKTGNYDLWDSIDNPGTSTYTFDEKNFRCIDPKYLSSDGNNTVKWQAEADIYDDCTSSDIGTAFPGSNNWNPPHPVIQLTTQSVLWTCFHQYKYTDDHTN